MLPQKSDFNDTFAKSWREKYAARG